MRKLDGDDIDAVIQAGTNLATARLAGSGTALCRRTCCSRIAARSSRWRHSGFWE